MRKAYTDLIKNKIGKTDFGWLFRRSLQYALIQCSFLIKKPLCGPILGTFITNYTCNFRCQMCDLYSKDEEFKKTGLKELSTVQLKGVLDGFAALGTSGIGFTGGEPLLRSDIFELLSYSKKLGIVTHLSTNGFLLNEAKANALLDCGVYSINISLDGAHPGTHNKIRGVKNAFEKAVEAISLIGYLRRTRKIPIRVKTVTVLSENNIDEVYDLIELATKLKADCIDFIPVQNFKMLSCGARSGIANYSSDFYKKLDDVVKYLLNVKTIRIENSALHLKLFKKSFRGEKSPLTCYAGYNSYGVDCYGLIYPCMPWSNWNMPAGNIREMGLKDFWYSKKYNEARKNISKCRDCYLNCQFELNLLFNPGFKNKE